jgi:hypothetical protein
VIAYVDSSVLVRFVLHQSGRLAELASFDERLTSQLTQLECLRALDRARLAEGLDPDVVVARSLVLYEHLRRMSRVALSRSILDRGGQAFPVPVNALDAVHLVTAMQLRERGRPELVFATHDRQQGKAALALGFSVLGL